MRWFTKPQAFNITTAATTQIRRKTQSISLLVSRSALLQILANYRVALDGNLTVLGYWKRFYCINQYGKAIPPKGVIMKFVKQQDYIQKAWFEAFKLLLI